jgi:hypothetical protein
LNKLKGPFNTTVMHLIPEPLASTPEGFMVVVKFASPHNIPIGGAPIFEGPYQPVFGIVPPPIVQGKQAAYLADKIFKGNSAGELPVVTTDYTLILNYKQAEILKLNITENLLGQANKIIR